MSSESAGKANFKKRWSGNGARPGVEACSYTGPGGWNREGSRYAVVTAKCRTEHDTFEEASEEYRIRRAERAP